MMNGQRINNESSKLNKAWGVDLYKDKKQGVSRHSPPRGGHRKRASVCSVAFGDGTLPDDGGIEWNFLQVT